MIFLNSKKCCVILTLRRFIPVHTGNSQRADADRRLRAVYPCAYRELSYEDKKHISGCGLSLCIQGTRYNRKLASFLSRFIPVHTGNSSIYRSQGGDASVYPCAYRELNTQQIFSSYESGLSLCIQGTH